MVRIAFVGREGRTIVESADGEHMAFGEIAGAIAAVLAPDLPDEASENAKLVRAMERLAVLEMHETSLKSLANTGEVPLIADCRLRLPVALPVGEMLRRACVPLRWVSDYCLEWGIGICDADAQALDYSEQQRFKAEQGRYTLEEAAKEMVVNVSADEKGILGNLIDAAIAGELPVYQPGKKQRYRPQVVLGFYEEAYWDDLNQWLEVHQKRIDWRFPAPSLSEATANRRTEKSKLRQRKQEEKILNAITELGYEPSKLPEREQGKDGVKALVRARLANDELFDGRTIFDKAWERLRGFRDIAGGE